MISQRFTYDNQEIELSYISTKDLTSIDKTKVKQIYGVCFYGDKIVLGFNSSNKWTLLGGKPEAGESFFQTLAREIKEESNMKLINAWPLGYQTQSGRNTYQLRYACIVEPFGEFVKDPAGGIIKIELVDPKDANKYLKWGKIGDYLIDTATNLVKKSKL